jgi:hypothetical protein
MPLRDPTLMPLKTGFRADSVASPIVRYGEEGGALYALLSDEETWACVTFEGFDAIRVCRGEYTPYETDESCPMDEWVFEVQNSPWLEERHRYESDHYKTPLLDDYYHYLFSFHDEFVELISQGIWIEKVGPHPVNPDSTDHPFGDLPLTSPRQHGEAFGIQFQLWQNPKPIDELVSASRLCSQKLFTYYLILDGETRPSYSILLRDGRRGLESRMEGGLFYPSQGRVRGVATASDFEKHWQDYLKTVRARRKEMGKDA